MAVVYDITAADHREIIPPPLSLSISLFTNDSVRSNKFYSTNFSNFNSWRVDDIFFANQKKNFPSSSSFPLEEKRVSIRDTVDAHGSQFYTARACVACRDARGAKRGEIRSRWSGERSGGARVANMRDTPSSGNGREEIAFRQMNTRYASDSSHGAPRASGQIVSHVTRGADPLPSPPINRFSLNRIPRIPIRRSRLHPNALNRPTSFLDAIILAVKNYFLPVRTKI